MARAIDVEAVAIELAVFGGSEGERRAVARQVGDLADSGQVRRDVGVDLTVDFVISELSDAPEDGPADRWNWWLGSMEYAYGGYLVFQVRRWESE